MFFNCSPLTNILTHQCYAALEAESDSARWRCLLFGGTQDLQPRVWHLEV